MSNPGINPLDIYARFGMVSAAEGDVTVSANAARVEVLLPQNRLFLTPAAARAFAALLTLGADEVERRQRRIEERSR